MWKTIGANIEHYRTYPRIVGETGGKDFVFIHATADVDTATTALIRGAFEYQGQKCSAVSRAYISSNLWPSIKERMLDEVKTIRVGDITDFSNFMGAVIDQVPFQISPVTLSMPRVPVKRRSFRGGYDDSKGYFIRADRHRHKPQA